MDLVERFIDARTGARPRTLIAYRTALKLVVDWQLPIDDELLKAFDYGLSKPPAAGGKRTYATTVRQRNGADGAGGGDGGGAGGGQPGRLKTVKLKYSSTTRQLYVTTLKPPAAAPPEAGCPGQAVYLLARCREPRT